MSKLISPPSNIELLISKIDHSMVLIRKRELADTGIAPRQLYILHIIYALGSKANASRVATEVDREVHVINKLLVNLEKDGFINRVNNSRKSRLLSLNLTDKGLETIKISLRCKCIEEILGLLSKDELQHLESKLKFLSIELDRQTLDVKGGYLEGFKD